VEKNGVYWKRYMKFRNSLRDDAWLAARYAEVKRRLAARHAFDRDAYTNGKTGFIEAVLAMPPRRANSVPMVRPPFGFSSPQPVPLTS
ncbi:MAG TPA: GrpB family protein, partial [Burkholderiaceae bacterium]|nr:GrpB family protein [Burkholderiaceae bacterium]